jgi:hypothetical protein
MAAHRVGTARIAHAATVPRRTRTPAAAVRYVAAREQLIARGVQASDIDVQPRGSFVFFSDPDGNAWALQQLPAWR